MITVRRVLGIDCPSKYLVCKDGRELVFVNSQSRASSVIQYLEGYKSDNEFIEEMNWNKKALALLKRERKLILKRE